MWDTDKIMTHQKKQFIVTLLTAACLVVPAPAKGVQLQPTSSADAAKATLSERQLIQLHPTRRGGNEFAEMLASKARRTQESVPAGSCTSGNCTPACAPGTTAAYDDESLGFRFSSEGISTSSEDGSLRWDAAVPTGLAFTMTRPPDPAAMTAANANDGFNFSEPSRVVPPGVPAGLHFESGPDHAFDQTMHSNRKVAIGAEHTMFAVVTPGSSWPFGLFTAVLGFRGGDGRGCFGFLMGTYGCPGSGPGEANENATGCLITV
jgi:hypothetical protein